MGNSIETPRKFKIVCGEMAYDEEKEKFECPPSTLNNQKRIPQKGREIPEGELNIKLVSATYEKDDKGNIVNVVDIKTKKKEKEKSAEI